MGAATDSCNDSGPSIWRENYINLWTTHQEHPLITTIINILYKSLHRIILIIMHFFKSTTVLLVSALGVSATHFHNNYGKNGWIQDNQGSDIQLKNGGSVTIGGGWGFFWVDSSVCSKNSVTYTWPSSYGGMFFASYDAAR